MQKDSLQQVQSNSTDAQLLLQIDTSAIQDSKDLTSIGFSTGQINVKGFWS